MWMAVLATGSAAACTTSSGNESNGAGRESAVNAEQVCKRMTPTGSSVPQRVCHTLQEWAAMERQGRADVEEFNRARDELGNPNPQ
jgi:hypothetical protein